MRGWHPSLPHAQMKIGKTVWQKRDKAAVPQADRLAYLVVRQASADRCRRLAEGRKKQVEFQVFTHLSYRQAGRSPVRVGTR